MYIPQYILLSPGHAQSERRHLPTFDLDVINNKQMLFSNHHHPLPSTTPSATRRQQPPPVSIGLRQPTAHDHRTARQHQRRDATSPGQHKATTTCHVV
jgi:hypothetical protein